MLLNLATALYIVKKVSLHYQKPTFYFLIIKNMLDYFLIYIIIDVIYYLLLYLIYKKE